MPQSNSVTAQSLDFRIVEIPPSYELHRYKIHDRAATIGGMPLTIRSDKGPWSRVVSFPARKHAFVLPSGETAFGWMTRVEGHLVGGCATLAHSNDDYSRLFDEITLDAARREFHVLLDAPVNGARLMVRNGETAGPFELQLSRLRSFGLVDDLEPRLAPPSRVTLAPMPRWARFYGNTSEDLAERVRYLRFQTLDGPRLMTWLDELEVLVVPREQVSQAVYVSGLYEPCSAYFLRCMLRDGDTFVDVGANIGLFSMLASRWVGPHGRVIAFEPSRRECERLRYHVSHNSLANVEVVQAAAGDHEGTAVLHVADAHHAGLNTFEEQFVYSNVEEAYTEVVPVTRIDGLVFGRSLSRVHAMKIDVEGGEHAVVAGARQTIARDRPALLLEVAGAASSPDHPGRLGIETFLGSLGYGFAAVDGEAGILRRTPDLAGPSENFLAAPLDALTALLAQAGQRLVNTQTA